MNPTACIFAVGTAFSSVFATGAGVGDAGSFSFAFYVGGTVLFLLLFIVALFE